CQPCHPYGESEILDRARIIQDRHANLLSRAEEAVVDLIQAIAAAAAAGASDSDLEEARAMQRKAQFRVDFCNAENSMGFHAPQEGARILGEAIDYARRGRLALLEGQPRADSGAAR
ncbi:MAG: ammonia-forming cytochrome c nitrite reductase subunit c552, partial [Phycisphaerales bacterium]|nr:ammonia-forming cytochrome c nitrite reductase subunit c552 [Phycisphaerales bacterium]